MPVWLVTAAVFRVDWGGVALQQALDEGLDVPASPAIGSACSITGNQDPPTTRGRTTVSTAGRSILLVDDDQEIRELLETYLSRSGFQVQPHADGAGFRQALKRGAQRPGDPRRDAARRRRLQPVPLDSPAPAPGTGARSSCSPPAPTKPTGSSAWSWGPTTTWANPSALVSCRRGSRPCCAARNSPRSAVARCCGFDDWRLDMVSHRLFHHDGEEVILSGADFALLKLFLDHPAGDSRPRHHRQCHPWPRPDAAGPHRRHGGQPPASTPA